MDPAAIRDQIDKILHSHSLATKSQLCKLLEVLHNNIDSQDTLGPDRVIKELWPNETKTKRAADVATEMNRLRHALESYYTEEGRTDPIRISLPKRSPAAGNGRSEKRWIVAVPRQVTLDPVSENQRPQSQEGSQKALKITALVVALCFVLASAGYFFFPLLTMPGQPRLARREGSTLIIMDAQGKELWRKTFPEGFGPESYYGKSPGTRVWFADLDGKGRTSVLFSYLPAPDSQPHSSTLICYSDRGDEKWRWTPGRALPEVGQTAPYKTFSLGILRATEKQPVRIVVLDDLPWRGGPSQIAVLNSYGKTLSEYWHSGGLRDMAVADLEGDGKEEIIATGLAHGYNYQATLLVLDPDRVFGASKEVQPEFQIHGFGMAQEKLRLLFPRSDLNSASFQYNFGVEPTVQDGHLRLKVLECVAPIGCPIWYELDKNLHLVAAHPGNDEFREAHDRFFQAGKDAHTLSPEEQAAFLRVRCLAGCPSEFVPVAQTYSPGGSFETGWNTRRNPHGVWSYGYSSGFTNPIALYDKTARNGINGPNTLYWLSSSVDNRTSPAAEFNHGPSSNDGNINFLANEFLLVAGVGGQYSDAIFTAPADGEYFLDGSFRGAQYGVGTVAGIVSNGKVVFRSNITSAGQLAPFRFTLNLQAGNTVVFSVGAGSGAQNTGLRVTLTRPCSLTDRPMSGPTGQITCSGRPE